MLHEKYSERHPVNWDPARPWDAIISASSWGQEDCDAPRPLAHWWRLHVEHPANLKHGDDYKFVAHTEGLRSDYVQFHGGKGGGKDIKKSSITLPSCSNRATSGPQLPLPTSPRTLCGLLLMPRWM